MSGVLKFDLPLRNDHVEFKKDMPETAELAPAVQVEASQAPQSVNSVISELRNLSRQLVDSYILLQDHDSHHTERDHDKDYELNINHERAGIIDRIKILRNRYDELVGSLPESSGEKERNLLEREIDLLKVRTWPRVPAKNDSGLYAISRQTGMTIDEVNNNVRQALRALDHAYRAHGNVFGILFTKIFGPDQSFYSEAEGPKGGTLMHEVSFNVQCVNELKEKIATELSKDPELEKFIDIILERIRETLEILPKKLGRNDYDSIKRALEILKADIELLIEEFVSHHSK